MNRNLIKGYESIDPCSIQLPKEAKVLPSSFFIAFNRIFKVTH